MLKEVLQVKEELCSSDAQIYTEKEHQRRKKCEDDFQE